MRIPVTEGGRADAVLEDGEGQEENGYAFLGTRVTDKDAVYCTVTVSLYIPG